MRQGIGVAGRLRKAWLLVLVAALVLLSGPAFALGLGKIEVRSQRGEPLLAEIAIISSDPAELENLQARLASPDTFTRIGLEPPNGILTDLQFSVALDPQGRPVIRVTSHQPVEQATLTFLLEVDWGQGRLVREYSVLVDAPRTVSAPAQPPIQAATVAPSNAIVREPTAAPSTPPAETRPEQTSPAKTTAASIANPPGEAKPADNAIPTPPAAVSQQQPAAQPVVAQEIAATPGEYGPVKIGDTLGRIVGELAIEGASREQTMLALLAANPEAFIGGNVNLIKRGAVLRVPVSAELSQYSAAQARAIVQQQVGQWREMRKPAVQPTALAGADGAAADTRNAAAGKATSTTTKTSAAADARLEIVPPSANSGRQAGTRSGIQSGGEGDMLQLQQTQETLAARDAEVQELKTRLADLEKLQHDQQQLIALKDSKLAEAQQALAASNQQQAVTTTAQAGPVETPPTPQFLLWPWLIAALVAVLLLAWWFMRRKPAKAVRPVFDTSRLAASMPGSANPETFTAADVADVDGDSGIDADADAGVHAAPVTLQPGMAPGGTPTWHAGAFSAPATDAIASPDPAPAGHERLELARAYVDLGDVETARTLLQEVVDGGDAAARGEAARLLRELS